MTQETLMKICPATGSAKPYPSHAAQWREYYGKAAWLFNPWAGWRRSAADVGRDPFGMEIQVYEELFHAAAIFERELGGAVDCAGQINQAGFPQPKLGS